MSTLMVKLPNDCYVDYEIKPGDTIETLLNLLLETGQIAGKVIVSTNEGPVSPNESLQILFDNQFDELTISTDKGDVQEIPNTQFFQDPSSKPPTTYNQPVSKLSTVNQTKIELLPGSQPVASNQFRDTQVIQLSQDVNLLNKELQRKDQAIENLKFKEQRFINEIEDLKKLVDKLQGEIKIKDNQLKEMRAKLRESETHYEQLTAELRSTRTEYSQASSTAEKSKKLKSDLQELQIQNATLNQIIESQKKELKIKSEKLSKRKEHKKDLLRQIDNLKIMSLHQQQPNLVGSQALMELNMATILTNQKVLSLEGEINRHKDEAKHLRDKILQFEEDIRVQRDAKDKAYLQLSHEKQKAFEFEKQLEIVQKNYKQKEEQLNELQKVQIGERRNLQQEILVLNETLQVKAMDINALRQVNDAQRQMLDEYKKHLKSFKKGDNSSYILKKLNEMETQQFDFQEKMNREKKEQQRILQEYRNQEQMKLDRENEEFLANMANQRKLISNQMKEFGSQSMSNQGVIDVCFIVDTTGSMGPYRDKAVQCVGQSMNLIKHYTNRITRWAFVCYQDFDELKDKGKYDQLDFTNDQTQFMKELSKVQCSGGGDAAEDLKGGLKQALDLSWQHKFRICIIITDAPCHGKKYHPAGFSSDNHMNEDMDEFVLKLCNQGVVLVCINFKSYTIKMFEVMREIFKSQQRVEYFLVQDMKDLNSCQASDDSLAKLLSTASQQATQTNQSGTKSKNKNQVSEKMGATEALYKKLSDPINFDKVPGIAIVETTFKIYRTEFKPIENQRVLLNSLKTINPKDHMRISKEGEWKCIRTRDIFARGQMKAVYLMKRAEGEPQLYVIKMPLTGQTYGTIEEAQKECISHLIAQKLMIQFKNEYSKANPHLPAAALPKLAYSDFLILEDKPNSYWIAERFFQGEFVKYNNNFGYQNDDPGFTNQFLQAFSYYTLFISEKALMVNDVQGVGDYLTDPAINTRDGQFDETDMGIEGQQQFMVMFMGRRLGHEILKSIKIDPPTTN